MNNTKAVEVKIHAVFALDILSSAYVTSGSKVSAINVITHSKIFFNFIIYFLILCIKGCNNCAKIVLSDDLIKSL